MISIIAATSKQINYLKRLSDKDYYSSEQLAKLTKKTASDLIQAWIRLNNACANINCIIDNTLGDIVAEAEIKAFGYKIRKV